MKIMDGTGKGFEARVDSKNRLEVAAITTAAQHEISHNEGGAYQVYTEQPIGVTDETILSLTNTSNTKDMIITYLRVHSAGAAETNENAYFSILVGGSRASGGTAITPTNMYVGSPNSAEATAYSSTGTPIVMSGTPVIIDKMHQSNAEIAYNKEGSLIVPKNSTISIKFKGSTVAGIAYDRISFYFDTKSEA